MMSQFSGADRMRALSLSELFARPAAVHAAAPAGPQGRRSMRLGAQPPPPDSLDFLQKLFDQARRSWLIFFFFLAYDRRC